MLCCQDLHCCGLHYYGPLALGCSFVICALHFTLHWSLLLCLCVLKRSTVVTVIRRAIWLLRLVRIWVRGDCLKWRFDSPVWCIGSVGFGVKVHARNIGKSMMSREQKLNWKIKPNIILVMVIASLLIPKLNKYIRPPNCLHYWVWNS